MVTHSIAKSLKAEVYHDHNRVYFVKVWMEQLGMVINSITVRASKKEEDWWVQMPLRKGKDGKFHRFIEFEDTDAGEKIRSYLEEIATDAVIAYLED